MPILLKSLQGRGYPLYVNTKVNEKLSQDGTLEFEIIENKATFDAIGAITKMWTVSKVDGTDDLKEYRIIMLDKMSLGNKEKITVKAREKELDDLNNLRVYETYTGSFTGQRYFDLVFRKTGYHYKLEAKVYASQFENLGQGDTNLELFKKGLERYGLEYHYEPANKTFILTNFVERKANYYIKSGVNANNVKIEEDASKCYTYIRGYGGFDNDQSYTEASLQYEFTHPLSQAIGLRHAPPIIDGRMKKEDTLKKAMEKAIADSLTVSVSLDFVTLKKYYPEAEPKIGDVVRVKDDIIDFNQDARIVEITTQRDAYNNIIKQDVVLGDFRMRDRYIKKVNTAANYVSGLGGSAITNPKKQARLLREQINANTKLNARLLTKVDDKDKKTKNGTRVHDYTSESSIKSVKRIASIGDSVAKGNHAKKGYVEMLADKLKAKSVNYAVAGATFSSALAESIYAQSAKVNGADLVIIQGTDDDWVRNIDIGKNMDDTKTFIGGFVQSVKTIQKNNPNAKIIVMTATRQCFVENGAIKRKDTNKNNLGYTLEDYVKAQVLACNELHVPVFDAYHSNLFDVYNPAFRKKNMPDGLHPNELLHEVIMHELIKNYHYFYDE